MLACGTHAIHRFALGASTEGPLVATKQSFVAGLAASPTELFWTNLTGNGEVTKCERANCMSPQPVAPIGQTPFGIVIANQTLYWANRDGS